MPGLPPPDILIIVAIVIFLAIGLHEYAHCKFADMAGDPTPGSYGRVTLNLTKHFELMGTLMMFVTAATGFGLGWGKPAPMDPRKMRNPRWDFFIAVLAGPVSNLLQAVLYAVLFRTLVKLSPELLVASGEITWFGMLLFFGVSINVGLAIFNLIPLGPLDGHWLLGLLMHEKPRYYWFRWNATYGRLVLMGLILFSQLMGRNNPELDLFGRLVGPIRHWLQRFLLGVS